MHWGKINESRGRTEGESDSLFPTCLGLKVPKHQMQDKAGGSRSGMIITVTFFFLMDNYI